MEDAKTVGPRVRGTAARACKCELISVALSLVPQSTFIEGAQRTRKS